MVATRQSSKNIEYRIYESGVFMSQANLLLLLAVFLPPAVLDIFGELVEERTVQTPYGPVGPLALRALAHARFVGVGRALSQRLPPREPLAGRGPWDSAAPASGM